MLAQSWTRPPVGQLVEKNVCKGVRAKSIEVLIVVSVAWAGQVSPACADNGQQNSASSSSYGSPFARSETFMEGRRLLREQRQKQILDNNLQNNKSQVQNSIQKSQDHSIEVFRGNDALDKSQANLKLDKQSATADACARSERSEKSKSNSKEIAEAPCMSWLNPFGKPKAVILCVHGLGLHSGSYEQFGKAMAPRGYAVYAVDVRGFGSWMAAKGREKCDFKHCSDDIVSTLNVLRMANPGVPIFLLGESMGGAIALNVAADYPTLIDGLISAVPAAERFQTGRTDMKVFLHLLTGNRKVNVEKTVVDRATDDPALRQEWTEDPLDRINLSAKELMQFQSFMNDNHDRAKKIDHLPVLIVQGGKDKLVKAEGTKELFKELVTEDKSLAMVNGAEHLVYEEGQFSREVLNLTDRWIVQRLPEKDGTPATPNMIKARTLVQSKDFLDAIPLLQQICVNQPNNPEPFVLLALAFLRTDRPLLARENVRKACMIARASKDAAKLSRANDLLLTLPPQIVAPVLARQEGVIGPGIADMSPMQGTYQVLIFSAKWCDQCKELEPVVNEARARFGRRVEFTVLDVDDANSQAMVEKYHVSPIPTMIFLKPNGDVADYSVGFSGISGMIKGIAKMLLPG